MGKYKFAWVLWAMAILAVAIAFAALVGSAVFHLTHHCAASHRVRVERYCTKMSYDPGDALYWVENCTEAHDEDECDRWERDQ